VAIHVHGGRCLFGMHLLLQLLVGAVVSSSSLGIRWRSSGMVVVARSLCRTMSLVCRTMVSSSGIMCGIHSDSGLVPGLVTVSGGAVVVTLRSASGIVVMAGLGGTLRDGAVVGKNARGGTSNLVVPWRIIINCWSALL